MAKHPELVHEVADPGLYLDSVPEVPLAAKLHRAGLLADDQRRAFVEVVMDYVVKGYDLQGLQNPYVRMVFTNTELDEMRTRVYEETLPRIAEIRRDWEFNCASGQSPDEYMQPLLDSLEMLKGEFGHERDIATTIDRQIELVNEWIDERLPGDPDEDGGERRLGDVKSAELLRDVRSVFDDVDA